MRYCVLLFWSVIWCVFRAEAQDPARMVASARFHGGVDAIAVNAELPSTVQAPMGKLTLFADFGHKDDHGVPLYLVNRSGEPATFESQDGDIYVKLQRQLPDGKWQRVQSHIFSWCGNSYFGGATLPPSHYFHFYGYLPTSGTPARVRFAKSADERLISNEGDGFVSEDDIQACQVDEMAQTAPRSIARSIQPGEGLPPDEAATPEKRVAAVHLLRALGGNLAYKNRAQEWAQQIENDSAATPQEKQAAGSIEKLLAAPWSSEPDPAALLQRCIEALMKQGSPPTEFGRPEEQPALVWRVVAELGEEAFGERHKSFEDPIGRFEQWKTVINLVGVALRLPDEKLTAPITDILSLAPLSDELIPNKFFVERIWDDRVTWVCIKTLARRDDRQTLLEVAWKLPSKLQLSVLTALAYRGHSKHNREIGRDPGGEDEEGKFWTHCLKTMPLESADALHSSYSSDLNSFSRMVHDPLRDYFAEEAARSDKLAEDFEITGSSHDIWWTATEFLDSWHLIEDTPLLQDLLNYKGYDVIKGSRTDPTNPDAMIPFVSHVYSVRKAAMMALSKRGVAVPKNLTLEEEVSP